MEFHPECLTSRQLDDICQGFSKERLDRIRELIRKKSSIGKMASEMQVTECQLKSWVESAFEELKNAK